MIRVAVRMPAEVGDPGEFIADVRALEAAGAHAVWLNPTNTAHWMLTGAIGALTERIKLRLVRSEGTGKSIEVLQKITGGRVATAEPPAERWESVAMPQSRQDWAQMILDLEAAGVAGVIVPWDARLIDLLRNPGDEDRSDLAMSTG